MLIIQLALPIFTLHQLEVSLKPYPLPAGQSTLSAG